uniref:Putative ovule protein n=1 Tax=Solanum chacoense TaxID=4108 RepID=A0A0V0GZ51_SOLCH
MAFGFGGRQMAGRALLGARTQLRGYCQKISPTKTSNRVGHDVRAFIGGGLVSACFYLYWLRNEAFKIKESRK